MVEKEKNLPLVIKMGKDADFKDMLSGGKEGEKVVNGAIYITDAGRIYIGQGSTTAMEINGDAFNAVESNADGTGFTLTPISGSPSIEINLTPILIKDQTV